MTVKLITKCFTDLKFYLIAVLSGLCFSMGFSGYDIPLPRAISSFGTLFLVMFLIIATISIYMNFNNIFVMYRNNRIMFMFIFLLVIALALLVEIRWAVVSLILMLVFYPNKYRLASFYLFFWSLFFFVIVILLGIIFPDLGRESVGKVGSLFVGISGLEASCLGFPNPNQPLFYLLIIGINGGFVFLCSSYRRVYVIIMMVLATVLYFLTLSRTSYVVVMIFLIMYFCGSDKVYKFLKKTLPLIVILFTAVSFFIATNYGSIGNPLNDTLTNRPYYWNLRVEDGVVGNIIGNKDQYKNSSTESALDNNYISLIARHGWIAFVAVFYLLVIWRREVDRLDDKACVLGLFAIMVYFLSESMPFSMVLCIMPVISIQRKFLSLKETNYAKQ